jgi:DNA-binding XRE family transcriptional regulator
MNCQEFQNLRCVVHCGKIHEQKKKNQTIENDRLTVPANLVVPVGPPIPSTERLDRLAQVRYLEDMRNCGKVGKDPSINRKQLLWGHCNNREINEVLDQTEEFYVPPKLDYQQRLKMKHGRQLKNYTQQQLAAAVQENVDIVEKYENGTAVPEGRILRKISQALNISLSF